MAKKGRAYYKGIFLLYTAAVLVCSGVRIVLELFHIDVATGFADRQSPWLNVALYGGLLGTVAALFLLSALKRVDHDYLVETRRGGICLLMVPLAASIVLFSYLGIPADTVVQTAAGERWEAVFRIATLLLGALSALALLQACYAGMRRSPRPPLAFLILIPCFWQLLLLVSLFNTFNAPVFLQENLLNILFMCFASIFLLGQARALSGFATKNGRNYAIPAGLATSLCGFVLVVPNIAYIVVNKELPPFSSLTLWQSVYILMMSIYSVSFVQSFCRSIKIV